VLVNLYRKLPTVVEVERYTGQDHAEIEKFAGEGWLDWHEIELGDFIVKDVAGVDVYTPQRFHASFAPLL
jgi:hypothetical protein